MPLRMIVSKKNIRYVCGVVFNTHLMRDEIIHRFDWIHEDTGYQFSYTIPQPDDFNELNKLILKVLSILKMHVIEEFGKFEIGKKLDIPIYDNLLSYRQL